jgi:S-formylglutathione hydrolase FrmB
VRKERVSAASLSSPNRVYVLVPPSYGRSPSRRYPVLYFLHDGYGDGKTLVRRGVAEDALAAMRDGTLPEFLIVAPDGPGTWFSDSYDGSTRFERFLAEDLPAAIASRYRVLGAQRSRGITGISMGGYGAVKTALRHPELYGSVSSVSGAIIPFEWEELKRYNWVARFTLMRVFGRDPEKNSLVANDAWHILWKLCFAGRRSSSSCARDVRRVRPRRRRGPVRHAPQRARRPDHGRARARRPRMELLARRHARGARVARQAL